MKSKLEKMLLHFTKGLLVLVILILITPISPARSEDANFKTMSLNLNLCAEFFNATQAAQDDPASGPLVVAEVYQTVQLQELSGYIEGSDESYTDHFLKWILPMDLD